MLIIQNTKFDIWKNSCDIRDYSKRSIVKNQTTNDTIKSGKDTDS